MLEKFKSKQLSGTEMKSLKGAGVPIPNVDWCLVNRWADEIAEAEYDSGGDWQLDTWYEQNCQPEAN